MEKIEKTLNIFERLSAYRETKSGNFILGVIAACICIGFPLYFTWTNNGEMRETIKDKNAEIEMMKDRELKLRDQYEARIARTTDECLENVSKTLAWGRQLQTLSSISLNEARTVEARADAVLSQQQTIIHNSTNNEKN